MNGTVGAMVNSPTIGSSFIADGHDLSFNAIRARLAHDIMGRLLLLNGQRFTACETDHSVGFLEGSIDRHPLVEHEAITVPVLASNLLKIPQDAALELLDVAKAGFHHDGAGLLATDPTCAEHHNGFVLHRLGKVLNGLWESAERLEVQIDGVVEGAQPQFVIVSRVEHVDQRPLIEHGFERLWFDGFAGEIHRSDTVDAHGNDFLFEAYVHSIERLIIREGPLEGYAGEPVIGFQKRDEAFDGGRGAGEKEVHAFLGQQDGAEQAKVLTEAIEDRLKPLAIVQIDKTVSCDVGDGTGHKASWKIQFLRPPPSIRPPPIVI